MRLTKYEHACLVLEQDGQKLIIDPGQFSNSLTDFDNVVAVVVTHIHPDHCDPEKLQQIVRQNPNTKIFTTPEVTEQLKVAQAKIASGDEAHQNGPFKLEFFGEMHAVVSPDFPPPHNIGVLINESVYYPGDSFTHSPKPYTVLALPIMAPWLKFSESLKYIKQSPAKIVVPTHNGFINEAGEGVYERWFNPACEKLGKTYKQLKPLESLTI